MTLRKLFVLNAVVIGILGLAMAVSLVYFTDHIRVSADRMQTAIRSVHSAEKLEVALLRYDREDAKSTLDEASLHALRLGIEDNFQEVKSYIDTPEESELVATIYQNLQDYFKASENQRHARMKTTRDSLETLVRLNIDQSEGLQQQMYRSEMWSSSLGVVFFALLVIAGAVTLLLQRRQISQPLLKLHETLSRFSKSPYSQIQSSLEGAKELQDISKVFNQMSETLIRQRESQFKVLAAIAHDLRNPLNGIKMSVDLLQETSPPEIAAEQGEVLQIVQRQTVHLDRLVGDLLDTTRIEAGDILIRKTLMDLREPAHEAVLLFKNTSAIHDVRCEVSESAVFSLCDPVRINQVLNNLLSNAIKYSPEGGKVEVIVKQEQGKALIAVTDHGIGIDPSDIAVVFEPFHRTSGTRETFPGVGLGLSAAKKIIEAHDGHIEIVSTRGQGTTFQVWLPLMPVH